MKPTNRIARLFENAGHDAPFETGEPLALALKKEPAEMTDTHKAAVTIFCAGVLLGIGLCALALAASQRRE